MTVITIKWKRKWVGRYMSSMNSEIVIKFCGDIYAASLWSRCDQPRSAEIHTITIILLLRDRCIVQYCDHCGEIVQMCVAIAHNYYYAASAFVLNIICIGTLNCTSNSMKLIMINCMHEICPNGIEKFLIHVLSRSKQPLHWWSLHACLRMQSTAEINVRVLAEDTALMGYHIPAEVLWLLIVTYSFQLSDYYTHCYIYRRILSTWTF